jgi:hypothetical protein
MKRLSSISSAFRPVLIVLAVLFLLAAGLRLFLTRQANPEGDASAGTKFVGMVATSPHGILPGPASVTAAPGQAGSSADPFRGWLTNFQAAGAVATNDSRRKALMEQGLALAEERRARMVKLIRENPEQALREALGFDEYAALPEGFRGKVERPFSEAVEYACLPVCAGPGGRMSADRADRHCWLTLADGASAEAFAYGKRLAMTSKHSLPASGVVLDGVAALKDSVFREVSPAEQNTVLARYPYGQTDSTRSVLTGEPVRGGGVMALAGNRLFVFSSREELEQLDAALSALDQHSGPNSGSSVFYALTLSNSPGGAFDSGAAEALSLQLASAWTETKKKVFLIRVDFSDAVGEPVTQAAASSVINGAASAAIQAMSYGKTWLVAGVSSNVYRLPKTAAYYVGGDLNGELIRNARDVFRTNRSGGDAPIYIGPAGDAGGLGDYDVVGIFFTNIGFGYAGLASVGGGDLWVQNANTAGLYAHELGHNYGLFHASFWGTTDGSVVGAGTNEEYGDIYDIMGSGAVGRGHYHPQAKARLNWLTTNQWADATAGGSGTYRVYRIDDAGTTNAIRGLRVTKSAVAGSEEYYWLGYRPAYLENPHLQQGAYLIWQRPGSVQSWLVDTTPGTVDGKFDCPVDLGRTYSDTNAKVHLTTVAAGGSGSERYLDVRVNLGAFATNHAPQISALTGAASVLARSNYTYSAAATDADGDALAYWWAGQDRGASSNSSAVSRSWTVGGTYSLSVTVSDMKGGSAVTNRTVVVSDPLDSWTSTNAGTTANLEDVLWGKGRCVSVDYFGRAYLSWDGSSWESEGALPGFENSWSFRPQLAYGANVFVVSGKALGADAAALAYSLDGRTWQAATFAAGAPQTRDVAYGAGQFVAVGDGGTVFRSTNGIQWTLSTVPGAPDFCYLTFDGTAWLAVALNASSYAERIWTSTDAVTWTQQGLVGNQVFDIFAFRGAAYAVGWYGGLKYSVDHGVTWQSAALPGTSQWTTRQLAGAEDGTLLMTAQAMDESGQPYALLVSADGRTWSRSSGNSDVASATHALAFGAGRFISAGASGAIRQSGTFYPDNHAPSVSLASAPSSGLARQALYFAASATDSDGDVPTYSWDLGAGTTILDGFEIAPIFSFGGTYSCILRVSDNHGGLIVMTNGLTVADPARTWTQRSSGVTLNLTGVAASAGKLVVVGDNGTVLTSTNGTNWSAQSLPDWGGNLYLSGVAWDGTRFQTVGVDYDWDIPAWVGVIYSSPDGVVWTRRYKSVTADTGLQAVTAFGPTNVAVGNNGVVLRAADGANWSAVSLPGLGTPTVCGVACGGGWFVLTAYTNGNGSARVFRSSNGLSWLDCSSGVGVANWQDLRKVAWLKDRFVASGWYSKLRVSTDSGQTFTTTRSHSEETPALAFGNGCWFAGGIDRDSSGMAVDLMSFDGTNWVAGAAPTTLARRAAAFFNGSFVTVGESGSIWQSGAVTALAGWPAWQLAKFSAGSASCLPSRDPDGDGVPNVFEYVLGRDPSSAVGSDGAAALPKGVVSSGRFWLRLDLPEPSVFDVNCVVQGRTNLLSGTWTDLARKNGTNAWLWLGGGTPRLATNSASGGRLAVDVGLPDAWLTQPKCFLRLKLEAP